MGTTIKLGESIFIPFLDGESVMDSQLRPRMYKSIEKFKKSFPFFREGTPKLVEYVPIFNQKNFDVPCHICGGKKTLYQHTNTTKLFMNTFGEASTLVTECMACPPYAECCMKGISANSVFKINFCPECGRPMTPEALEILEKRLRG